MVKEEKQIPLDDDNYADDDYDDGNSDDDDGVYDDDKDLASPSHARSWSQ